MHLCHGALLSQQCRTHLRIFTAAMAEVAVSVIQVTFYMSTCCHWNKPAACNFARVHNLISTELINCRHHSGFAYYCKTLPASNHITRPFGVHLCYNVTLLRLRKPAPAQVNRIFSAPRRKSASSSAVLSTSILKTTWKKSFKCLRNCILEHNVSIRVQ